MTKRIFSTLSALVLVVAALVTAGTMTAGATETGECTTEYSGWVTSPPAGDGWVLIKTRKVTDEPGYTEPSTTVKTFYVLRGWDKDEAPSTSSPGWLANPGNHNGHPDPGPNTPYTTGADNPENPKSRNWFYYSEETVPGEYRPPVTHDEYKYKRTVCTPPPDEDKTSGTPNATGVPDDCDENPFGTITVTAAEGVFYTLQDGSRISGTIESNGTNTVTANVEDGYKFPTGAQTSWTFTSETKTDCPNPPDTVTPFPAQFSATPTPPTCDTDGALPSLTEITEAFPNVLFGVSPESDGPGTYTVTVTPKGGYAFNPANIPAGWTLNENGSASKVITVGAATGVTQSTNPAAACYQAPGDNPDEPGGENPGDTPDGDTPATGTNVPVTSSGAPAPPQGSTPSGGGSYGTSSGGVPTSIDAGQ